MDRQSFLRKKREFKKESLYTRGFPSGSEVKNLPANTRDAGDLSLIPGSGRSPGGEMATHSSIFAWKILWTEESGWLQSMGCQESDMTEHTCTSYIPIRMIEIKSTNTTKCWWGYKATGNLRHCWGWKIVQLLWKWVWQFVVKHKLI